MHFENVSQQCAFIWDINFLVANSIFGGFLGIKESKRPSNYISYNGQKIPSQMRWPETIFEFTKNIFQGGQ